MVPGAQSYCLLQEPSLLSSLLFRQIEEGRGTEHERGLWTEGFQGQDTLKQFIHPGNNSQNDISQEKVSVRGRARVR